MKKLIFNFLFFYFNLLMLGSYGQVAKLDSIESILNVHLEKDTARVNLLNELAYEAYLIDIDKTLKYATESQKISKEIGYEKGEAKSLVLMGIYYDEKSDFPKALTFYDSALQIYEDINDKEGLTNCYNNIGIIYRYQGDYTRALEYYFKALRNAEELNNKNSQGKSYNNIGVIYYYQGNYTKALEYYQKSLKIDQEIGDKSGESYSLNNIGIIYEFQSNFPKALEYYQKSLLLKEELGNKSGMATGLNNVGNIYRILRDYSNAYNCFRKSLDINKEIGKKSTETYSYVGLAGLYLAQKNANEALRNSQKAYSLAREIGNAELIKESAEILAKSYYALKKYKEAYDYHVIYKSLNDSLFSEKNTEKITTIEYHYKYEKKKELAELTQKKRNDLILEKERREAFVRNALIVAFVLMSLMVLIVYRNLLHKRKTNEVLEKQKEDIEWRNRALFVKNDEIKEQSERLEIANAELKGLNDAKDKFFSIISHDLKSPFNAILGYSGLLSRSYDQFDDQKRKEMIEGMNISANSAFMLLEDLLTWSRTQLGGIDFSPVSLDLKELIDETVFHLEGQATNKSQIILNEVPENTIIYADRNMISGIVRNLVSNGIKFTHKGGQISIFANNRDEDILISVSDTGVGIPKDKLSKLFELSEKSMTLGTSREKGTGLGLVLCKEFVEHHGGKMFVESEINKGSTFSFTIPLKK